MQTHLLPKVNSIYPNHTVAGIAEFYVPQEASPTDGVICGWNVFAPELEYKLTEKLRELAEKGATVVQLILKDNKTDQISRPDYKINELLLQ